MRQLSIEELDKLIAERQAHIKQLKDGMTQIILAAVAHGNIEDMSEEEQATVQEYHELNMRIWNIVTRLQTSLERLEALRVA